MSALDQSLLELEQNPENYEVLNEVFRYAHTLKGMSSTMGFGKVAELSHKMENLLDKVRQGEIHVSSDLIDVLLEALDKLREMVNKIAEEGKEEGEISDIISKLESFGEDGEDESKNKKDEEKKEVKSKETSRLKIRVELSEDCALKSVRAFMVIKSLDEIAEIIDSSPPLQDIEDGRFEKSFELVVSTSETPQKIKEVIEKIGEVKKVEISETTAKSEKEEKKPSIVSTKNVLRNVQTVRVSIDKLDSLMNLVGELVIGKSRLFQIGSKYDIEELREALSNINRLTTNLQDIVTQMRMVEVGFIFNRFPRMVRDLAKKEGKKVNFIIEGKDIELDRTVLDEIGDPLVHLLRNSIDHGIETPEERIKAGKSEVGTLKLIAKREKNHVKIIVEDDGRGIDPDKIRKKAVEKGIITEEEANKISDEEALSLIFAPGLSTAEKVTDVSGRGVGMDVVKSKITSLGGVVEIKSKVREGTRVTLTLPLTLAIIQALLIKVRQEIYAIPLSNVLEILNVKRGEIKTVKGNKVINLRGKILPIIELDRLLGISENGNKEKYPVVVVDKENQPIGLGVDGLIGQQEIVIKTFDNILKGVKGFAGATILGDGRVVLILDIASLL
ncbi:MAG: chemotaxis protein CheA [Candidatus Hydrothermarchaeota archaeon]|nr:MAG: chemotaxis protein CheA [Candidatus Hydrothermarchaeota archaeon]